MNEHNPVISPYDDRHLQFLQVVVTEQEIFEITLQRVVLIVSLTFAS